MKLLHSFMTKEVNGDFYIGVEDYNLFMNKTVPVINGFIYNLDKSLFLKTWLKDNEDIIPTVLGGRAKPCNCREPWSRKIRDHKVGCNFHWFNRNASRWFRKIVTLNKALEYGIEYKFDYMIWIDADCEFKQKITLDFVRDIIFNEDEADIVYLRGRKRTFLEAGLVGYNIQNGMWGITAFNKLKNLYSTGTFRKLQFWDDCHCLEEILNISRFNEYDLATTNSGTHSEVFPNSLIGNYITHNKGRHGRKLRIMK